MALISFMGLLADLCTRLPCVAHAENTLNRMLREIALAEMERAVEEVTM